MGGLHVAQLFVVPCTEDEHFLLGTRLLTALEMVSSYYLKAEFRKDYRQFLEDLDRNMLSTIAAPFLICMQFLIDQGLSCFSPKISFGGDNYSELSLLEQSGWSLSEGLGQSVCVGAIQGRTSNLRERADAAGAAFPEEVSWCGSHSVLPCPSDWISCSPEFVPREYQYENCFCVW